MYREVAVRETNELRPCGHNLHPDPEVPNKPDRTALTLNCCEYIQKVHVFELSSLQKKENGKGS